MSVARSYRKYPEAVKLQIAKSQNPYLLPEYEIPRTTALYWIRNQPSSLAKVSEDSLVEMRLKDLERALKSEKALTSLVERVRIIFPHSFKDRRVSSKPVRRKIVEAVRAAVKLNKLRDCLRIIGLSRSTYSNWLSEFFLCEDSKGRCKQRKPHQLTHDEIDTMRNLVTAKKYSHMSIQALCLHARREALLFCSLDSWYKYKKIFGWARPRDIKKEKDYPIGVRATRANELWHVDVTQVKIQNGTKVYVQVIYDNYSKYTLAWKASMDISALNTVELIRKAKERAVALGKRNNPTLMSDAGTENVNSQVLNFITSKSITRMIARVDIHFSNSMVESLFRMLKSNFLKAETLRSQHDVERKIDFFFTQHNEVIPRHQFDGATPLEKYLNTWTQENIQKLQEGMIKAAEKRVREYQEMSCSACHV